MARQITQIKVWKNSTKTETRIYVDFENSRTSGCYYKTGNRYQAAGTLEDMTQQELNEAYAIVQRHYSDGKWHTIWKNEMQPAQPVTEIKPTIKVDKPKATNRHACTCSGCNCDLAAGEGELMHLDDEEDIDRNGGSRWLVFCLDTEGCTARRSAQKAERKTAREAAEKAEAERKAKIAAMTPEERTAAWENFMDALQNMPDPR